MKDLTAYFTQMVIEINKTALVGESFKTIMQRVIHNLEQLPDIGFAVFTLETGSSLSYEDSSSHMTMTFPLIRQNQKYGEIILGSSNKDLFNDTFHNSLQMITDTLTLIRHQEDLASMVQKNNDQLDAFRAIITTFNGSLSIGQVLDRILVNLETLLRYKASNIHLIDTNSDPGNRTYRIVHSKGYDTINMSEPQMGVSFLLKEMPIYLEMMKTRQPVVISDTHGCKDWTVFPDTSWIRSYASAPIRFDNEVIGFINVDSTTPNDYNENDADLLQIFADEVAVAIYNARLYERAQCEIAERRLVEAELQKANDELEKLANLDSLTKIPNRRSFDKRIICETDRLRRVDTSLSLILIDIDFFKNYNDAYGHQKGDECLSAVAGVIQACSFRSNDLACRYGGEEFAVILPDTPKSGALEVAEKIRRSVELLEIEHRDSVKYARLTCSLGVYTMNSDQHSTVFDLVNGADRSLYMAKQRGRNRVCSLKNNTVNPEMVSGKSRRQD